MRKLVLFISVMFIVFLFGCTEPWKQPKMNEPNVETLQEEEKFVLAKDDNSFEVELMNDEGVGIGIATIKEQEDGVHITLDAHHLPAGLHGFHIHEHGVCETPSFESAGGHFNPTNKFHGFYYPKGHHIGDLENIVVAEDGTVNVTVVNQYVTLKREVEHSLLQEGGTSLIIHAQSDDYISQPAGDAGERIACGVIK